MSNIVDAYPREGVVFRTKPLFQWDWGQIVRLHISDLPASYKVEFSNSTRADAVSTVQTTDEVTIPAQFLESGNPVYAWVVVVDEARTTEYSLIIPVSARAKPTDLEPSPEEHSEIEQAIAALNQAVEQTAADVDAAGGYAEGAEQSAGAAAAASETAVTAKNTAETKASEASTAAQNASASASQANTSAQNAASFASAAVTAKDAAESAAESVEGAMATLEATIQADLQAAKESGEFDGPQGPKGDKGDTGAQGPQGIQGEQGIQGHKGDKGDKGDTGSQGPKGDTGATGATGPAGPKGDKGDKGAKGDTGAQGPKGDKGDTGDTGATGPQGAKGDPGDDYVLTTADKAEIAQQAAEEVDVPTIATAAQVKSGIDAAHFLAPSVQDNAVFYALAKAAGADMASSSNPVGTYTDAAKVAIQKMLGIYEAPWELIREDTVTNATEADIDITVDGNGDAFELTDARIKIVSPQQETEFIKGDYGRITFVCGSERLYTYIGEYTTASNGSPRISYAALEQSNGMLVRTWITNTSSGSDIANVRSRAADRSDWWYLAGTKTIDKIIITSVKGTLTYILYGKRKW